MFQGFSHLRRHVFKVEMTYFLGEVIKHEAVKCILNEGMPHHKDPFTKGSLAIHFKVNFPENNWIETPKLELLEKCLPPRTEVIVPDESEQCALIDYVPQQSRRRGGNPMQQAYDSDDDDDMRGGQRVQCASQ